MSVIDHPDLTARYFYPREAPLDDPFIVTAADGVSELHCWRSEPRAGKLAIVHFHGNGEVVADYLPDWADALAALDVDVVLAEYRGYGSSTGEPCISAVLDDAVCIVDALGVPPERVIAYGRSLGAYAAVELAQRRPRLGGLVLESAIADPLERIMMRITPDDVGMTVARFEAEVLERLDHRRKLAGFAGRMLVMHAAGDTMVP